MSHTVRKIVALAAVFITVSVGVVLINQSLQLAMFAERFHPVAGDAVFWGLIFFFAGAAAVPVVLFFRMPAPLSPPASDEDPAFPAHVERLKERLARNPALEGTDLNSKGQARELPREDRARLAEALIQSLDEEAEVDPPRYSSHRECPR